MLIRRYLFTFNRRNNAPSLKTDLLDTNSFTSKESVNTYTNTSFDLKPEAKEAAKQEYHVESCQTSMLMPSSTNSLVTNLTNRFNDKKLSTSMISNSNDSATFQSSIKKDLTEKFASSSLMSDSVSLPIPAQEHVKFQQNEKYNKVLDHFILRVKFTVKYAK